MNPRTFLRRLRLVATAPYRDAGRFAWHFARGKLGGDPVFRYLLESGLIPDGARVLDLGCGQGLLAAWLLAARRLYQQGMWPAGWPAAPRCTAIHGLELMASDVARANEALAGAAQVEQGDIRTAPFPASDVVVILDVLHYIDIPAQDAVLERVRECLAPNGTLLLRVGDAAGGLGFAVSNWVDRMIFLARGHRDLKLYCRSVAEWRAVLERLGFAVDAVPKSEGTPFANVLLISRLGDAPAASPAPVRARAAVNPAGDLVCG